MQPLFYRPNEFDDWGQIRNADGSMFASVRRPLSEGAAAEHRRNKTDPFEDLATRLIASFDDDEKPRYTTHRLHDEIRKAEERGRQMERDLASSTKHQEPIGYISAQVFSELLHDNSGTYDITSPHDRMDLCLQPIFASAGAHPGERAASASLTEDQISAVMHLIESRLCIIWPKISAREEFENALRVLEPAPDDEVETCEACNIPFKDGDMVYWRSDDSGHIHADCCGPERESYVNADGEPLKDGEPIPKPFAWRP